MKLVEKGVTFRLGSFTITPFNVPHDSLDNVGYRSGELDVAHALTANLGLGDLDAAALTDDAEAEIAERAAKLEQDLAELEAACVSLCASSLQPRGRRC